MELADQQVASADVSTTDTTVKDAPASMQDQLYPDDVRESDDDAAVAGDDSIDGGEGQDGIVQAVDAPHSWNAEDKAVFATLTPEAQAVINRREAERDAFVLKKGEEVVQVRKQVEGEARQLVQQIHQNNTQQYEAMLQQVQAFMPAPPDDRLLWTGNPQDMMVYHQQKAVYDQGIGQYQSVHRQLETARQQATVLEQQAMQEEIQRGQALLEEKLGTDWTEPSKRKLLLESLEPIGKELGYADRMGAADATDILALKNVAAWKAKADKYDDLQRAKMTDVRAHKGIPKVTQPGSGNAQVAKPDITRTLYPNDPPRR